MSEQSHRVTPHFLQPPQGDKTLGPSLNSLEFLASQQDTFLKVGFPKIQIHPYESQATRPTKLDYPSATLVELWNKTCSNIEGT